MNTEGLIFDFDGLIIDTEGPIFQSWQELYQSYGCQLSLKDWGNIIGTAEATFDPARELEKLVGEPLDWSTIEVGRKKRETELIERLQPLPGVAATLLAARKQGLKVALASSSSCEWVTGHLRRLGLIQYFDCIVASDDVRRTKPDPELFLQALNRLGISASQAVVFEDSPNGVLAANRAGIFAVAVPSELTRNLRLDHADLRLDSLADFDLEAFLEGIELRKSAG